MLMVILLVALSSLLIITASKILINEIIEFYRKTDIPPYLLSFFSISIGTSLPEISNSIVLSLNGFSSIGFLNLFNNVILDFTLVFGIIILLLPNFRRFFKKELTISMLIIFIFLIYVLLDGIITRIEGIILFSLYIFVASYIIYSNSRKYIGSWARKIEISLKDVLFYSFLISASVGIIIANAIIISYLVSYLVEVVNVSEYLVGFILSFFTILPELLVVITSCILFKRLDIGLYNLFGVFITDLTFGAGITASIVPVILKEKVVLILFPLLALYLVMVLTDLILLEKKVPREVGYLLIGAAVLYILIVAIFT